MSARGRAERQTATKLSGQVARAVRSCDFTHDGPGDPLGKVGNSVVHQGISATNHGCGVPTDGTDSLLTFPTQPVSHTETEGVLSMHGSDVLLTLCSDHLMNNTGDLRSNNVDGPDAQLNNVMVREVTETEEIMMINKSLVSALHGTIYVTAPSGSTKQIVVKASGSTTVGYLKQQLQYHALHIMFNGLELAAGATLAMAGVRTGDTLQLVLAVVGGGDNSETEHLEVRAVSFADDQLRSPHIHSKQVVECAAFLNRCDQILTRDVCYRLDLQRS